MNLTNAMDSWRYNAHAQKNFAFVCWHLWRGLTTSPRWWDPKSLRQTHDMGRRANWAESSRTTAHLKKASVSISLLKYRIWISHYSAFGFKYQTGKGQLMRGYEVQAPVAQAYFDIYFSSVYVWRGWFIGMESRSWVSKWDQFDRAFGFNHAISLSMLCSYTCPLAGQTIHPSGSINLSGRNNGNAAIEIWWVAACKTCINVVASIVNSIYQAYCTPTHHRSLWNRVWRLLVYIRRLSSYLDIIIVLLV